MELLIIRHAQSTNNASMMLDPSDREVDPPLTDLGLRQADALASHLADGADLDCAVEHPAESRSPQHGYGITRMYVSPMRRALQTCQPISRALGLSPEVWVAIHEHGGMFLDQGEAGGITGFPGLTRAEIAVDFPGFILPRAVTEFGWWYPGNGLEDLAACQARAVRVAESLRERAGDDERIALVTHGTFADCLLKALLNLLPGGGLRFNHYNTAISRLDFRRDGVVALRYLNRVGHLDVALIS